MTGAYRVVVQNRKIKFDFEIRRNITILRGDSATGKTTLVEMIREYEELGLDSGIELQCEKDCVVLSGRQWEKQLSDLSQSIIFIDEGSLLRPTTAPGESSPVPGCRSHRCPVQWNGLHLVSSHGKAES